MEKKSILAVATLTSTIIGVGFFSLPYVTQRVGTPLMLGYFIVLGGLVLVIHLVFSEVALKTPDFLRLPGYAQVHLGEMGKTIALWTMILGSFGSLLAYLIMGGKLLAGLNLPLLGPNEALGTIVYFLAGAALTYWGINPIARVDFWSLILILGIFGLMFFQGKPFWRAENIWPAGNLSNFFLPYGPILFSFWGASMLPEIEEMLGKNKSSLKKVVLVIIH